MSAALLIILIVLGLVSGTLIYYGSLFYTVYRSDQKKKEQPRVHPECESILGNNNCKLVPSTIPINTATKAPSGNPYPKASDLEEDAEHIQPVTGRLTLEEPDSNQANDVVIVMPPKKMGKGSSKHKSERKPLLEGDDEDGLIVPKQINEQPKKKPAHVAVGIDEAKSVPPEKNIQKEHPVSHAVVSVPIVMSAGMPVYDESNEELNCTSLQEQQMMATLKASDKTKPAEEKVDNTDGDSKYGWSEEVKPDEKTDSDSPDETKSSNPSDGNDSESSDPEINSYSFVAEEEPANDKEPISDIKILKYTTIDEGNGLDTPKSGEPKTESRQSPDGLSIKSLDNEVASTNEEGNKEAAIEMENLKKKCKVVEVTDSEIL